MHKQNRFKKSQQIIDNNKINVEKAKNNFKKLIK